jgi:hypothetical protein
MCRPGLNRCRKNAGTRRCTTTANLPGLAGSPARATRYPGENRYPVPRCSCNDGGQETWCFPRDAKSFRTHARKGLKY